MLLLAGCTRNDIETRYGERSGPEAASSVNGTAVFADMFAQAGHKVISWDVLSPRLKERADCIVWFPDDFAPPSYAVRNWLEDWLWDKPCRTLIYVGRDFDAACWYWAKVQAQAPPEQSAEVAARRDCARREFRRQRRRIPERRDCEWFTTQRKYRPRTVRSLSGDPKWREDIDATRLEIELAGRITPGSSAHVLLQSQGDMLLSRQVVGGSQLFIVANGSFLLNLPLVNHEHRKLAGKLIDQVGPPGRTVAFLESRGGGPLLRKDEPAAHMPSGLEILRMHPVNWIFLHFAVVGILFCFSRWLIFGVSREVPPESTSDFGKHIRALAELLRRSGDRDYANARVLHYQQMRDEGRGARGSARRTTTIHQPPSTTHQPPSTIHHPPTWNRFPHPSRP